MADSSALLRIAEGSGVDRYRLQAFLTTLGPEGGALPWESEASELSALSQSGLFCLVPTLEIMTGQFKFLGPRSWGNEDAHLAATRYIVLIFNRGIRLLQAAMKAAGREDDSDPSTVENTMLGLCRLCLEGSDRQLAMVTALCCGSEFAPIAPLLKPLIELMSSSDSIERMAGTLVLAGEDNSDTDSREEARSELFSAARRTMPQVIEKFEGASESLAASGTALAMAQMVLRSLAPSPGEQ